MAVFSEIWSQDMSSPYFLPKNKFLISRPSRWANQKADLLAENRLNSCLRKKLRFWWNFWWNVAARIRTGQCVKSSFKESNIVLCLCVYMYPLYFDIHYLKSEDIVKSFLQYGSVNYCLAVTYIHIMFSGYLPPQRSC